MTSSLLQQIRECNTSYRAGQVRFLDSTGDPFIVLACIDPRLTGFLEPALGLPRHRALVVRVAGNQISGNTPDVLRSIAAAAYVKGGRELLIVGHTDCAMARFSAQDVIESFRDAGVSRSAFGDGDLRTWFGAFADIRANVLASAAYIRLTGILPKTFKVHGLILGTDDGSLDVVVDGDAAPVEVAAETPAKSVAPPPVPEPVKTDPPVAPPPVPPRAQGRPVIVAVPVSGESAAAPPASVAAAAMVLRDFFVREKDSHFQQTVADLRALVKRERNPARIISVLERISRDYRGRYPELPAAIEYLKQTLHNDKTSGMQFLEFVKRILD
jgi:carbonic anhydrase